MKYKFFFLLIWLIGVSTSLFAEANYVRGAELKGDKLKITFKFPIKKVRHFILAKKGFTKHIYDIEGGVLPPTQGLPFKHKNVKSFRIGQYNKETLRIVIESKKGKNSKHYINSKVLIISLPTGKSLSDTNKKKEVASKRLSAKDKKKGTGSKKLSAKDKKKGTGSKKLSTKDKKKGTGSRKLSTKDKKKETGSKKLSTKDKKKGTGSKKLSTKGKKKGTGSKKLSVKRKKPKKHKKIVVIDAGHGGRDNGASSSGVYEKKITLIMAYKVKKQLEKMGYKVYLSRTRDRYISLLQRTEYANKRNANIFVSIHANAAPREKAHIFNGLEVFYLSAKNVHISRNKITHKGKTIYSSRQNLYHKITSSRKRRYSKQLAKKIEKQISRNIRRNYGPVVSKVKCSDFWVLTGTKMPSILVETGFVTHKKDRKRLQDRRYQNLIAKGIAEGINSYFHGKK